MNMSIDLPESEIKFCISTSENQHLFRPIFKRVKLKNSNSFFKTDL